MPTSDRPIPAELAVLVREWMCDAAQFIETANDDEFGEALIDRLRVLESLIDEVPAEFFGIHVAVSVPKEGR